MSTLINLLKGFFIGIANVVAGLSGGTVAVICHVYDDLIDFISNVLRHPIVQIKKNWKLLLGLAAGIVVGAVVLKRLYGFAPLPVSLFFSGIVVTSLIPMFKNSFTKKDKRYHYIAFVIGIILLIGIPFLTSNADKTIKLNFSGIIILLSLGIVSAAAMIIPGVSGSMILASCGYYEPILGLISDFVNAFVHFDFNGIGNVIGKIIFFALGCLFGLIGCAILIKSLFKKCKKTMDHLITGLVAGSCIAMVLVVLIDKDNKYLFNSTKGIIMWLVGIILFGAGLYLGNILNRFGDTNNMKFDNNFFLSEAKKYTNEWLDITKKLVSFPSVLEEYKENSSEPFGKANKEALEWILAKAKEDGFDVLNCDNYAGHIAYGDGDETLGVLAHLDVVPAVGNWSHDPFDAVVKEDKLIGRGVNDDKGPLSAAYCALKILKEAGFKPSKNILLIMGCDEESGSRCLEHYFSKNPMPEFGFSPDACYPCINGEKAGIHYNIVGTLTNSIIKTMYAGERYNIVPDSAYMTLTKDLKNEFLSFLEKNNYNGEVKDDKYYAYGISAHAMTPQKGLNAIFILFKFLNQYAPCELSNFVVNYLADDPFGKKLGIDVYHPEMKELTQNVGIIRIEENKEVFIGVDCRVPVDNHENTMLSKLDSALKDTSFKAVLGGVGKTHYVPKDSLLVKTLLDSYREFSKDYTNDAYSIGGGTYAKFIDNAVAFGPQFVGREDVDHQTDEYVYIDDYTKSIAIYAKAIYELTK